MASSGTKGLIKRHLRDCTNEGSLTKCSCPWRGRYTPPGGGPRQEVQLAKWAHQSVDPHEKRHAEVVFARFVSAVDNGTFRRTGERSTPKDAKQLAGFILQWLERAEEKGRSMKSLPSMLGVISESLLGGQALTYLSAHPEIIEQWLDDTKEERSWSDNTWNRYHELLHAIFKRAVVKQKITGVTINPLAAIERQRGSEEVFGKFDIRIEEDIEDKLLAACDQLNRPAHKPNRSLLTQEKADQIRARVAKGEQQTVVAAAFKVSPATVCAIVQGKVWNPAHLTIGTKGTEMRRRVIAAFDGGLRLTEMLLIQVKHVARRPLVVVDAQGQRHELIRITLPARNTKGGKWSGQTEYCDAGTPRFKDVLTARLFQFRDDPEAYVFGTEDGKPIKGFRKLWQELYTLAGLKYGRNRGMVWHTLRHEYISRLAETTGDPVLTQELARHKDLETTQKYFQARGSRRLLAAVGLSRGAR